MSQFKEPITAEDLASARKDISQAIQALTKSSIHELRAISKPHPMIEKTMMIVCALRGYKNLNWNTAKDLLSRPNFKVELTSTTP